MGAELGPAKKKLAQCRAGHVSDEIYVHTPELYFSFFKSGLRALKIRPLVYRGRWRTVRLYTQSKAGSGT